jgi:hypothetical protein
MLGREFVDVCVIPFSTSLLNDQGTVFYSNRLFMRVFYLKGFRHVQPKMHVSVVKGRLPTRGVVHPKLSQDSVVETGRISILRSHLFNVKYGIIDLDSSNQRRVSVKRDIHEEEVERCFPCLLVRQEHSIAVQCR